MDEVINCQSCGRDESAEYAHDVETRRGSLLVCEECYEDWADAEVFGDD